MTERLSRVVSSASRSTRPGPTTRSRSALVGSVVELVTELVAGLDAPAPWPPW